MKKANAWQQIDSALSIVGHIAKFMLSAQRHDAPVTQVWKAKDGSRRYLGVVSKATKDLEREIVEEKGMDFSIALSNKHGVHSNLYIEHLVPQTKIGHADGEVRIGPFWLEWGRFDDTPLADLMYKALEEDDDGKRRLSAGFLAPLKQKKAGRYRTIWKYDTSVTLTPAHPETLIITGGQKDMDDAIKKLLKAIGEDPDSPKASTVELLQDLFATATKSADITAVEKVKGGFGKLMEALGDNEEAKALCEKMGVEYETKMAEYEDLKGKYAEMEEKMGKPKKKMEGDDKEEDKLEDEKKSLAPIVLQLADRVLAQDAVLETQLDAMTTLASRVKAMEEVMPGLVEEVKSAGTDRQLAAALASLASRLPKEATRATRPTTTALPIDAAALKAQLAGMEKALGARTGPAHPLAGMTAGPGVREGGA